MKDEMMVWGEKREGGKRSYSSLFSFGSSAQCFMSHVFHVPESVLPAVQSWMPIAPGQRRPDSGSSRTL